MFSDRQDKLLDHLLRTLGFNDGVHKNSYKSFLTSFIDQKHIPKYFTYTNNTTGKLRTIDVGFNAIDHIFEEIEFRKLGKWEFKNINKSLNSIVTASDLAAYTFCPVSYSIINTFQTEETSEMNFGTQLHEKFLLLKLKSRIDKQKVEGVFKADYENHFNETFFKEVSESTLIHSGHVDDNNNLYNSKRNFVGNPDYVFENKQGKRFVVEEKFKQTNQIKAAFDNHKIQLASYIYELDIFKADYGYLLYWYYDKDYDDINVTECKVFKIDKTDAVKSFLNVVMGKVLDFNNRKKDAFEASSLNPRKCVSCSVNKWCGHKSGKFNELEFPYNLRYLGMVYSRYSDE